MRQRTLIALCCTLTLAGVGLPAMAAEKPAFISFGDSADAPAGYIEMCVREPDLCQPTSDKALPAPSLVANEIAARSDTASCDGADDLAVTPCDTGSLSALHTASLAEKDMTSRNNRKITAAERKSAAAERKSRRSLAQTVRIINHTVNRTVRQRSDLQIHGMEEYWQPSGLGADAVGDCEDIALQKKLLLLESGFPPDRLFLAVVFRSKVGLHTVLVARLDDGDMVLDSASKPVRNWRKTPYSWLRVQSPDDPRQWYRVGAG